MDRLPRRKPSTLYTAAFSYDCNYDYVIIISGTNLHCSHLAALSASGADILQVRDVAMATNFGTTLVANGSDETQ